MGFIKCFLKGVVEKNSYRKLAANLYFVYGAMEEEMERLKDHPLIKPIYFPELNRQPSLAKDLQFFYGSNWKNEIEITPHGQAYVDRIREIAQNSPRIICGSFLHPLFGRSFWGSNSQKYCSKSYES